MLAPQKGNYHPLDEKRPIWPPPRPEFDARGEQMRIGERTERVRESLKGVSLLALGMGVSSYAKGPMTQQSAISNGVQLSLAQGSIREFRQLEKK